MSYLRHRLFFAFAGLTLLSMVPQVWAQAPAPNTMTTIAGSGTPITATNTQCPNLATGVKSTDAAGDGCLAANMYLMGTGSDMRGGIVVDAFGTVYYSNTTIGVIQAINPTTGLVKAVAGLGTLCTTGSGQLDGMGDGCTAATGTKLSGTRGLGIDPYGNLLIPQYGYNAVNLVCNTLSPLCSSANLGKMYLVAGCSTSTSGTGTAAPQQTTALPLADNVAAHVNSGTCSTTIGTRGSSGEVGAPRGATADRFGNVWYGDTDQSRFRVIPGPLTSTYFSGNNPLYAALQVYSGYSSITAGYVYTVVNFAGYSKTGPLTAATVKGANCATNTGTTAPVALNTAGGGCPFNYSSFAAAASSGSVGALAVDAAGDMIYSDQNGMMVNVFYVGGTQTGIGAAAQAKMQAAILANNPSLSSVSNIQAGYIYPLIGGGTGSITTTPVLGTSVVGDNQMSKVFVGLNGNIYVGDNARVLIFDINTGYVHSMVSAASNPASAGSYCNGGSSGPKAIDTKGSGCPMIPIGSATTGEANFGQSNALSVAADWQGDIYIADGTNVLIRKVLAGGVAPQTVGTSQVQLVAVHVLESAVGAVSGATATLTTDADMTAGSVTCNTQNADFSFDCTVPVTMLPTAAGLRSATVTVSVPFTPNGGSQATAVINVGLGGTATGSVLAFDSPAASSGTAPTVTTNSIFSGITPAGVALDGAGNVYTMDTTTGGRFLEYVQGTGSATIAGTLPTTPGQIAVDQTGDIFAVGSGTSSITELAVSGAPASPGTPSTYSATSIAYTPVSGTATPQAIAVDVAGNLFIADKQGTTANTAIYRLSLAPSNVYTQVTVGTGFTNPVSLAVDPTGNVYVADKGTNLVYKLTPVAANGGYTQTTVTLTGITPVSVAVDAAGNLYVQDSTSLSVIEVPLSGPNTTVLTGLTTPVGLAVDGKGNVYSADAASTSITQVVRDVVSYNFGTGSSGSPTFTGTLTNVGNQAVTGSNPVTNTTNFSVVAGSSNGCTFASSVLGAQAVGNACTLSANFVGGGSGTVSDVLSYLPAASTVGSLTLTGTLTGTAIATTTTISGQTPSSPVYLASGTEVSFTVTVAASSGASAPGGTVAVTVDSTTTNPALIASGTNGVATVNIAGLAAGSHTISAIYATSGSFTGSNSGTAQGFSIAQVATSVSWTPSTTTQQVSSAIGNGVLNATSVGSIPGAFVYTATPSGGSATPIDASTALALGTYSLGVTFVPTDSVDYTSSTGSVASYTVTQAITTAPVGASQVVVAADGTGNYTTVQAAVNAVGAGGGSIYVRPGTYTGMITVVQPNVSIRGLGGDPTKVILTHSSGSFSVNPGSVYNYAGEFNSSYSNGSQLPAGSTISTGDEGSATLVVARSINTALSSSQMTPYNFYGENFTLVNTYDSDTTTTTTTYVTGGVCTANAGPAQTYNTLFNAGTQCASQALAIWITADQTVMNNTYLASLQDTIYAGSGGCGSPCTVSRQYWWRGKVTGVVDYIFGDAAAVFDHDNIFTAYRSQSTIEAQNKSVKTGSSNDYLSGYVFNSSTFTSQQTGQGNLFLGRPYGTYSTTILLNSYIDQMNPLAWEEFSGDTNLPTSTYVEYNTHTYTDPATGSADLNGVIYTGAGGNTGSGVTGTRETTSQDPGTPMASNAVKTVMTAAQAAAYYPAAFLGTTIGSGGIGTLASGASAIWNPTAALATGMNAFVPSATTASVNAGGSITILMRPQTPGGGILPTGTYTLQDGTTTLVSGTLDATGEAYYTTSALSAGSHSITWTYGGDANFAGSSTVTPLTITVGSGPFATTTTLAVSNASSTYGTAVTGTVTVAPTSGSGNPTGTVTLLLDTVSVGTCTLNTGACSFSLSGITAGGHSLVASYSGDTNNSTSTSSGASLTVAKVVLTLTATSSSRTYGQPNSLGYTLTGFVSGEAQASATTGSPSITTTATQTSAAGAYTITAATGTLAATNYSFTPVNGTLTVNSGAVQKIFFAALPNFPIGGPYQLTARSNAGQTITYSVTTGSGIATVSGTTLTVTGAGTITITANAATINGFSAAPAVSRTFTSH